MRGGPALLWVVYNTVGLIMVTRRFVPGYCDCEFAVWVLGLGFWVRDESSKVHWKTRLNIVTVLQLSIRSISLAQSWYLVTTNWSYNCYWILQLFVCLGRFACTFWELHPILCVYPRVELTDVVPIYSEYCIILTYVYNNSLLCYSQS